VTFTARLAAGECGWPAVHSSAEIGSRPDAGPSDPWRISLLDANYGRIPDRSRTVQPGPYVDACPRQP
jgi:hypothetical protein